MSAKFKVRPKEEGDVRHTTTRESVEPTLNNPKAVVIKPRSSSPIHELKSGKPEGEETPNVVHA